MPCLTGLPCPNMRLLDKAPTDYTKPQQTTQPPKDNTKPRSPANSNAPPGMGVHPGLVWGSPRTGMGSPRPGMGGRPDRYGGPGIGIINIGYIELGPYFMISCTTQKWCTSQYTMIMKASSMALGFSRRVCLFVTDMSFKHK